jgi:hypothetical protein
MSVIIDFGEEPIRCQPVAARTSIPERAPVRATSYRAESLELGNYSHRCRVRRLNALRAPRVDIAIEFGPDHPSRYTVAGHDIREMSTPFNNHYYRMSHWLQDQQSAMDPISRVPDYGSLNQHRVSPVNLSPPTRTETHPYSEHENAESFSTKESLKFQSVDLQRVSEGHRKPVSEATSQCHGASESRPVDII